MKEVGVLFSAQASSIWDTMTSHNNTVGYRIPNYQRSYDWSEDKIARLLDDCLNGFYSLSQSSESFTFLGTLILVRQKTKETGFDGVSLDVVDGQQRLTTLVLTACSLIEQITSTHTQVKNNIEGKYKRWIDEEVRFQLETLFVCAIGEQTGRRRGFPYPRIVRDGDYRSRETTEAEYLSLISRFLMAFATYYEDGLDAFISPVLTQTAESERFTRNYGYIKQRICELSEPSKYEDIECEYLPQNEFQRSGLRGLLEKLDILDTDKEKDRAISYISQHSEVEVLVRLLLFSSYFTRCVVLTRVITDDESSAFDIFDSLNTTGEPISALETLKPRVIQFETKQVSRYAGSESEREFRRIDENVDDVFVSAEKRQKERKELLVSFALYMEGHKLPQDLRSQRSYLRSRFDKIPESPPIRRRRFVAAIADIAEFRRNYWDRDGIDRLSTLHGSATLDQIQLCTRFIADLNTSLALPILARYWTRFCQTRDDLTFLEAVKALTAFIVLWRATTGTTGGIETAFRALMGKKPSIGGDPLSFGLDREHSLLETDAFRKELVALLRRKGVFAIKEGGILDKGYWMNRVSEIPLADKAKPLARFLLLAAAHHSATDVENPGLWTRERGGIRHSDETDYLNYRTWVDEKYNTLEHVAPVSESGQGWDERIYQSTYTKHTLGNLVLLPQQENSSAGNDGWVKKKLFYLAITAKTESEQTKCFKEAESVGFAFKLKTKQLLAKGHRLPFLDAICHVEEWTDDLIKKRTLNVASLAWDSIVGWLDLQRTNYV